MASKSPITAPTAAVPAKADTPVSAPVVKTEAAPIPKADPVPAKAVEAPVAKAAAKPALKAITAPAAKLLAKKKAVVKAAPRIARKAVKSVAVNIPPVAAKARAVVTKEVNIMEATIKNAAEKAKSLFTDANAKSTKAFEDMNEFSKGNIEAIVESGKIAAKGIEAIGQDAAEFGRKQFEGATAALKGLSSVKSPTDFFKMQGDYMRTSFDSLVAQTSKNTEAMLKLAGEVAQPISNRVAVAVEKVKVAA